MDGPEEVAAESLPGGSGVNEARAAIERARAALRRLQPDCCAECGEPIPEERQALHTRLCIRCAAPPPQPTRRRIRRKPTRKPLAWWREDALNRQDRELGIGFPKGDPLKDREYGGGDGDDERSAFILGRMTHIEPTDMPKRRRRKTSSTPQTCPYCGAQIIEAGGMNLRVHVVLMHSKIGRLESGDGK